MKSEIQQENLTESNIKEFLIFFKQTRGLRNRELAEKIHYYENYLTRVRNGDSVGGEKLLHDLETFFLLDNLQQISQYRRQKDELDRQIAILEAATIEKFYAERQNLTPTRPMGNVQLNERAEISYSKTSPGRALARKRTAAKATGHYHGVWKK